ncbi:MAG TPA: YggS family pyridoxal phosphate-dependent enzyme [Candidatus Limnocylindrales bacterium]|nr:YggS family pyridoxal phosphate-dependent enzyme [Candidatus Limnocylindrales bacterium]
MTSDNDRARTSAAGSPPAAEVGRFRFARDRVLDEIADACRRADRNPAAVALVAVTKGVAAERVAAAIAAGQREFGENRVQEGAAKAAELAEGVEAAGEVAWHLIGPLQSNKARLAVGTFATIDSVDSIELARRLDRHAGEVRPSRPLPILLQVNVDADPAKHGWRPADLEADLGALANLGHLRLDGLMTIGRLAGDPEDARPTFVALRKLAERLRATTAALGPVLSMGMSDDYPVAVEEGATQVRVGRALFGPREGHRHGHC